MEWYSEGHTRRHGQVRYLNRSFLCGNKRKFQNARYTCGVTGGSTEAGAASTVTISNAMLARSAMM